MKAKTLFFLSIVSSAVIGCCGCSESAGNSGNTEDSLWEWGKPTVYATSKQVLKLNFNYLSTHERNKKKVRCKVQSEGRFGGHQGARSV